MTGQGSAAGPTVVGTVRVELRAVNHRGFKCSTRVSEAFAGYETRLENALRKQLRRGSVQMNVTLESGPGETPVQINAEVLGGYLRQCQTAIEHAGGGDGTLIVNAAALTSLPGVLSAPSPRDAEAETLWEQLRGLLLAAVQPLIDMRQREGAHMAASLLSECDAIDQHIARIATLAPDAAEAYRSRLESKVKRLLSQHAVQVDQVDLLREVQVYADKADVSEELTRLESHLKLFRSVVRGEATESATAGQSGEPTGRRLDFIIQEMFRETNTIGSKSALADISAIVVEIKCAIERMRELVQNVE